MKQKVKLDIEKIREYVHDEIMEEFAKQFGEGRYTEWKITATKISTSHPRNISCESCRKCGETTCGNDMEYLSCYED